MKLLCYGGRADGHLNAISSQLPMACQMHILDDRLQESTYSLNHLVLGKLKHKICNAAEYEGFVIAVGDNYFRKRGYDIAQNTGIDPYTLKHDSAVISESAEIGKCCFIGPNVTIGASVRIGDGVIVNSNTVIEHDSVIGKFSHIAPGCSIAGRVKIGYFSFIGIGSCIIPDIEIGESCVVGAGSTVVDNIEDNTVAFGEKARPKRKSDLNIYARY